MLEVSGENYAVYTVEVHGGSSTVGCYGAPQSLPLTAMMARNLLYIYIYLPRHLTWKLESTNFMAFVTACGGYLMYTRGSKEKGHGVRIGSAVRQPKGQPWTRGPCLGASGYDVDVPASRHSILPLHYRHLDDESSWHWPMPTKQPLGTARLLLRVTHPARLPIRSTTFPDSCRSAFCMRQRYPHRCAACDSPTFAPAPAPTGPARLCLPYLSPLRPDTTFASCLSGLDNNG